MMNSIQKYDFSHYSESQCATLEALLSRYSAWPLTVPGPSEQELNLAIDIALRAPDHGHLKPWRFVVIQGDACQALADVFEQAARQRGADDDVPRMRSKALAAPVIIALGVHITPARKVPAQEQAFAVAAAAMNILNALQAMGYSGFWGTGPNAYDANVQKALGFADDEQLIGFLYAGTPKEPKKHVERPDPGAFIRYWTGG